LTLLFVPFWSLAQQYDFRNYGPEEGLVHAEVNQVIQDSKGFIWVATSNGVSQFDGHSFENFSSENGLSSGSVVALAEDLKGRIWVSVLGQGIDIIDDGLISHLELTFPSNEISAMLQTEAGMWVGTFQGACLIQSDSIVKTYSTEDGLSADNIHSIFQDSNGFLWFGTFGGGISKLHNEGFTSYHAGNGLVNNYVTGLIEDVNGDLVISTLGGVSIFKRDQFINITRNQGLINSQTNSISIGPRGRKWLASFDGMTVMDRSETVVLTTENGLPHNEVSSVIHDNQGNTWIGTKSGLSRLNDLQFSYLDIGPDKGLEIEPTSFLIMDSTVWLSNEVGGVFYHDGFGFLSVIDDLDLSDHPISSMVKTIDGNVWVGTSDFSGLISIEGEQLSIYADDFGLADNNINCLETTSGGDLVIGTPNGLSIYNGDFEIVMMDANPDQSNVTALAISEEDIWAVGMFDGSIFKGDQNDLKRIEFDSIDHEVNDLLFLNGHVLAATEGMGLYFFGDSIVHLADSTGLSSNYIRALVFCNDELIITTSKGIDIVDPATWIVTESYNRGNGLKWTDCQVGAVAVDGSTIWIGTSSGVIVMNRTEAKKSLVPPRIIMKGLQLFYKDVNWALDNQTLDPNTNLPDQLELSYSKNYLRFQFVGIEHQNPENVSYQWILEGFEAAWNPPTSVAQANYPNLPPGDYVFKLKACSFQGSCSENEVEYSFSIEPPFWQTTWFYLLLLAIAVISTYSFIKVREQKLIQEKEILEATVEERTKELREQKEIVEAQHEHITEGIEYARNIQMAILPSAEEMDDAFEDHFVLYSPKETVGGDFYWTLKKGDEVWAAAVDCTGHGVAGAFMSMIGSDLLNQIIIENGITDPEKVLAEMDKGIVLAFAQSAQEFESDQGMDVCLLRVNLETNKVDYAGAQRPLYIISDSELQEIDGDKAGVSSRKSEEEKVFTCHTLNLKKGDQIYMTSDGYADQFGGPKNKKFMTRRLKETILENQALSMHEQGDGLKKAMDDWLGTDNSQIDDIIVFGIKL
jgi:ligand-binding sensor domain-containing protein/serine phosphatase RsbU (regulator of sigma subunit)